MDNFHPTNKERRFKAYLGPLGTTQLHLRNPYVVAWWSAAFPGFGHLLLSKYIRGFSLFIWEVFVNSMSNLNHAIVFSFIGNFEMAKEVLDPRWLLLYLPVYMFAIWDSYRTTMDINKEFILAERENAEINTYSITSMEINYLDKRRPIMAVLWSLMTPGLGQLYIHRIFTAIFTMGFMIVFVYFSNALVAVHWIFLGDLNEAKEVIDPQWFLFIPSNIGFAVYDSYTNTVENNKLYESEQRKFLRKNYQHYHVKL
ncbi:hypothetical protein [Salipaludibacillus daqingensis]|uniref:hypothetical protein n=1 Tax=Salipaludibacillus daqingensis TaxID=3041001 RepID=UPI002477222B|nr:hypothetical protein [Salipaludibacillus daqingensis]